MKKHKSANHQLLISKRKQVGIKYLTDLKTVIEYSYDVKDAYPNINDYDPEKKIIKHRLCHRVIH